MEDMLTVGYNYVTRIFSVQLYSETRTCIFQSVKGVVSGHYDGILSVLWQLFHGKSCDCRHEVNIHMRCMFSSGAVVDQWLRLWTF